MMGSMLGSEKFRYMNRILIIIMFLIGSVLNTFGQEVSVNKAWHAEEPMTVPMQRQDANGQVCAIIKVQIPTAGVTFEGSIVGEPVFKTNEYWVYVTQGTKKLNVKVPGHYTKSVSFEDFGILPIEAKNIYYLVLSTRQSQQMETVASTNYVIMQITPANAVVKIDGNIHNVADNAVTALLPIGQHTYQVEAGGYVSESGSFNVLPSEKTKLNISLKSSMALLRIKTDTDVSIYVNGNPKGNGEGDFSLLPALYNVELQKPGYRTYVQTVELRPNETFNLTHNEFIPIYGTLNVDYRPIGAIIKLDGKIIGESPLKYDNLIIGKHNIRIELAGYDVISKEIEVRENLQVDITGILQPINLDSEDSTLSESQLIYKGDQCFNSLEYDKSLNFYLKAIEKGNTSAYSRVGWMYFYGFGINQDYLEAAKWYHKSAEQGDDESQQVLGYMYNHGLGLPQDLSEALKWYKKSAAKGNSWAQNSIGYMYYYGQGVKQDYREAERWYRQSAEQGNEIAQRNLGNMYETGIGVTKNLSEALKWYRKAADQGYSWAQNDLGYMYYRGHGIKQNYSEAEKWFRKAAEEKNVLALYNLGTMYANGLGVNKNSEEAKKWFSLSSENENEADQFSLGYMFFNGYGVSVDKDKAQELMQKAVSRGDQFAKEFLNDNF